MRDRRDLALGWLEKARSDVYAAESVLSGSGPYDTACFHAQQAVEKSLKAFLSFLEQPIPRTHDLDELQRLCAESSLVPELQMLDLTEMTDYAVHLRYDIEFWPEKETAESALGLAMQVMQMIREVIGA